VRNAVGYYRYHTPTELSLLNEIYALLRTETNFFSPPQKLVEKHRDGAKVTKRYDTVRTCTRVSVKSLWERCDQRFCCVTRRAG